MTRARHHGLSALVALGALFAAALAAPEAHAYNWYCRVVDGPNSPTSVFGLNPYFASPAGHAVHGAFPGAWPYPYSGGPFEGISATFWNGNIWTVYAASNANSGSSFVKYGYDGGFPASNPNWTLGVVDGPATYGDDNVGNPAVVTWNGALWVAYTSWNEFTGGTLWLGGPGYSGPVPGTIGVDRAARQKPALTVFNNQLWIVYETDSPDTGPGQPCNYDSDCPAHAYCDLDENNCMHHQIHYSVFDGSQWTYTDWLFDDGTKEMRNPSVAQMGGLLYLFYYDATDGYLRASTSSTGQSWLQYNVDTGGVGEYSATVVDPNQGLFVFYSDRQHHRLKSARLASQWSNWAINVVDGVGSPYGIASAMSNRTAPAGVLQNGPQVYYFDDDANTVRGAWFDGTNWHPAVIDGGSSSLCKSTGGGATTHHLNDTIAAVQRGTGPHVFYRDTTSGDLREAFQY